MLTKKVSDEIKKTLIGFNQNKMYNNMLKHYKILHLIDENGKWTSPELEKISNELLPQNITEEKSKVFVDEIAKIAEKNPYLMNFFSDIKDEKFENLSQKVKKEGSVVLPDALALTMVLEHLSKAIYKDPQLLGNIMKRLINARKQTKAFNELPIFHKIKLMSIEPVIKRYVKTHTTGQYAPKRGPGPLALQINIIEATISDYLCGNVDNAKAGLILATNKAGARTVEPRTGEGPTVWSDDKKACCLKLPLPKEWTDLYQTWNMAFVSKIPDFPYIMPKLLIPHVADYQEKPTEYLYKRAIALYLYLNHACFDYVDKQKHHEPIIDWRDKKLTQLWGKTNFQSAINYELELAKRKDTSCTDLRNYPKII